MTPQPPPDYLAKVKAALDQEPCQTPAEEQAVVARRLQVPLAAAFHLIRLARGEEVEPQPPRTIDR